jgi:ATP-dependent Clp protease, protease subunit
MAKFTKDDLDKFYDYDIDVPHRTIYLGSDVDDDGLDHGVNAAMAERIIKALHLLDQKQEPITILMNNPGGDWYHGMAIYDAIKGCQSEVTIKATGYVMSMGAVIFQAADHRLMTPNAKLMIHYGTAGSHETHSKIFQKWAKEYEKVDQQQEDLLLEKIREKHPTFKREELEKLLNYDAILTAKEAVNLGLADDIL